MSIGRTTLRIANWIVIGIAAVNVAVSITAGKVGLIPNIVIKAVCCLIVIELLWRFCRAVIVEGIAIEFRPRTSHSTSYVHNDDDSSGSHNPATGLPMMGTTDVGGHHWGCCD